MRKFKSLVCAVLVIAATSIPAQAAVISLGQVNSPTVFNIGNEGLLGNFEDRYDFSVALGGVFDFSAFVSTGFSNRFGILDFTGRLLADNALLATGISETRHNPFIAFDVRFPPVALVAGDYSLFFAGDAFGAFEGITASYSGNLSFAPTVGVASEPGMLALFVAALLGLLVAGKNGRFSRSQNIQL